MSGVDGLDHDAKYELHRNVADFQPNIWGNYFLQYASESMELDGNIEAEIEKLRSYVKKMLVSKNENPLENIHLIDSICRLGVDHYFEHEIEEILQYIHNNYVENGEISLPEDNLCSLSVLFRLLRQQGLYISPNVFNKFKDDQGNFSEKIIKNIEGMLSLYEATHLMVHGEDILEEALVFTTTHLESIANQLSHSHAIQVKHSLRQPIYKNLPRLEARRFISIYEQDPFHDKNLLTLAKLDFNMLQSLHQKEFGNICKWWKGLDARNKLPYSRDRVSEASFWALGINFESQDSTSRKIMAKLIIIETMLDDTYDAFGTIDELELFTKAIERWNICDLDNLPYYMKFLYRIFFDLYEEIEEKMIKEGRVYALTYFKKIFLKYVQGYMIEARWLNNNYKPTLEEYIQISRETSGYALMTTTWFICMGDIATEDIFKWISNAPKIMNASAILCRLMDDIVSYEFEKKRDHICSFMDCYMMKYNVSMEVAIQEGRKRISDAWKDINEAISMPTEVPMPFLKSILNLSRFIDVVYKDKDNFTNPEGEMKTFIKALLIDPVQI